MVRACEGCEVLQNDRTCVATVAHKSDTLPLRVIFPHGESRYQTNLESLVSNKTASFGPIKK